MRRLLFAIVAAITLFGLIVPMATPAQANPAFPTVAAVNGGNDTTAGTSHTVNLPTGITNGDLLIVFFACYCTSGNNSTITFPGGWSSLFDSIYTNYVRFVAYYRIADGAEGATITVNTSGSTRTAHTSYRITGYSGTPVCGTPVQAYTRNPNPPALNPAGWDAEDTLWLAVQANRINSTVSAYPANYTNGRNDYANNASGCGVGTARRELNAASENPGTFTISTSRVTIANTVAIRPASESNNPPVASNQSVTTDEGTAKAITLMATDADGDTLTYSIIASPSHGSLSGPAPNVTYTPNSGYNGSDGFTFKANDGTADSNTATVSITVTAATITFTAAELLGRPTDSSVTVNVVVDQPIEAYFQYGTTSGFYTGETTHTAYSGGTPIEVVIDGLSANTRYYYRMVYRKVGTTAWIERDEHSFYTQRSPGSTFTFTIIADSHMNGGGGDESLYEQTLDNVSDDHPDFHLDLGDTFWMDGVTSSTTANQRYLNQRQWMSVISHSAAIFIATGNHENEEGWNFDDANSKALLSINARKLYYPNPIPGGSFYTGNTDTLAAINGDHLREDYYAWEWGDTLFVVIDPFHYTMDNPYASSGGEENDEGPGSGDRWDWTLGQQQFNWFKQTLENSDATFKFIFAHHMVGGSQDYVRGGAVPAHMFEWGGYNADGTTWGFDTERPGWEAPIRQLMIDNHVSAFFHGHDHEYAYEVRDGIVYQLVPQPGNTGYGFNLYHESDPYTERVLPSPGHLRVIVSPTQTTVEYIGTDGTLKHSYTILPASTTNHPPVANAQSVTTNENTAKAITLTASDADGDALTYSIVDSPTHGTLSGTEPDVTYTPAADYNGPDSFTFKANDGTADSNTATVSITVTAATITVNDFANYRVFQRDIGGTSKSISINGTYANMDWSRVEARVLQHGTSTAVVGWTTIDNTPGGGTFSGSLVVPQGGWYNIEVRALNSGGSVLGSSRGTNKWGVGMLILCIGQSNMSGHGQQPFTVANSDLAVNYSNAGIWEHLADPYDDDSPAGAVDNDNATAAGSMIPALANSLLQTFNFPIAFIPSAKDGTNLYSQWVSRNPSNHYDTTTLYGQSITKVQNAGGVELIIMHQGEADTNAHRTEAQYEADFTTLIGYYRQDLYASIPIFICQLGTITLGTNTRTDADVQAVRNAQHDLDNGVNIFMAATAMDQPRLDAVHYTCQGLDAIGGRMAQAIKYYLEVASYYRGPAITSAAFAGNRSVVDVQIAHRGGNDIMPASGITGFSVLSNGSPVGINSAARLSADRIRLTLASAAPQGAAVTLRYLWGSDPDTTALVKDNSSLALPLENTTIDITVIDTNSPPVAVNDAYSTNEDTAKAITLTATDADGDTLTYAIVTSPAHGSLTGTPPNVTYTPVANYNGPDSFTFKANDGTVDSNIATVSISVNAVNDAPDQPTLLAPHNGSVDISTDPTLEVIVSDPDADNLDVTFYGRETGASADEDFTIIVLPDTQLYSQSYPSIFTAQTQWIVGNQGDLDIVYVAHEGDIVNTASSTTQWDNANNAMSLLENPATTGLPQGIPYGVLPGNHDQPTTNYNSYFGISRFAGRGYYGGYYGGNNDNNYGLFSAAGMDFIVINLQYSPTTAMLDWADGLLKTYSDRQAIVVSHYIINTDNSWGQQAIFTSLKDNPNLFLMLCGHMHNGADGEGQRTETGDNGNTIYVLLANYQDYTNGGNGYLRILQFSPADDEISVKTYSPYLGSYETDADSQFVLAYEMDDSEDFVSLGTVSGVTSGASASIVWPNLASGTTYEWYVKVSDGSQTTAGPVWSFSTGGSTNNPPVANAQSVTTNEDTAKAITLTATDADGDTLTYAIVTSPAHGSLTGTPPNVTYTPAGNYNSSDSFTFKANDGKADSNTATVSITVTAVNDPPVVTDISDQTIAEGSSFATINLDNYVSDVDNTDAQMTWTYSGNSSLTVSINGSRVATISIPNPDWNGAETITFRATDPGALWDDDPATFTVTALNDAPVANAQSVTTNEDTAKAITLTATDADGDTLTYSIVASPAHGSLTGTPPNVTYTPAANYSGPDSFTFKANDGKVDSNIATVSITVSAVNDAPVAPSNLAATAVSTTQINLSWQDNSSDETGFRIERKAGASGSYAQIATTGTNVTTYNDSSLSPSTTYYYRVRAYNADGDSAYSNEASATTQSPPPSNNLALNKPATADSEQTSSGNTADKGNDGNSSTRWSANNSWVNHWWKVDLGDTYTLTGTKVQFQFARLYRYKIEVSTDNTNWTMVADQRTTTSNAQTREDSFSATPGRYVRITYTFLPPATWASHYEFEVYGN